MLPRFTAITITQLSEGETATFKEAYGQNRMKSLLHYWLALIESPVREVAPFAEILADEFSLALGGYKTKSFDDFRKWLANLDASHMGSGQKITGFSYREIGANRYEVTVDLNRFGAAQNRPMSAENTQHRFQIIDNPTKRFPRIVRLDVATA